MGDEIEEALRHRLAIELGEIGQHAAAQRDAGKFLAHGGGHFLNRRFQPLRKGALKMLTKGMAIDWGPLGLQVNGIGPGYFKTELNEKLVADPAFTDWLVKRTPSRRWGDVDELGPAAVLLASEASSFMNGHILYVDGGVTATL